MKKRVLFMLLAVTMLLLWSGSVFAQDYDYVLSNLRATSDTVSVDVTRASDRTAPDVKFFAVYDEYDRLIDLVRQAVPTAEEGKVYTVEQPLRVNQAVTVKAFIWDDSMTPRSAAVYKTTRPDGDIEDGGDL